MIGAVNLAVAVHTTPDQEVGIPQGNGTAVCKSAGMVGRLVALLTEERGA